MIAGVDLVPVPAADLGGGGVICLLDDHGRKFVHVGCLARKLGVPVGVLDHRARPDFWGAPGHFCWRAGRLFFAVEALPDLVEPLQALGFEAAAKVLPAFIASLLPPRREVSLERGWLLNWEETHA